MEPETLFSLEDFYFVEIWKQWNCDSGSGSMFNFRDLGYPPEFLTASLPLRSDPKLQ